MNFNTITTADLVSKHSSGESADNKIRKAWTLQMPDEVKDKFKNFPSQVKIQLYKSFDKDVKDKWIELMSESNKLAIESGAKVVKVGDNIKRLEDKFCGNPDELLIKAAQLFIIEFNNSEAK